MQKAGRSNATNFDSFTLIRAVQNREHLGRCLYFSDYLFGNIGTFAGINLQRSSDVNVFVFLNDNYADWEIGYVLPELVRTGHKVTTFGVTGNPVRSMGSLVVKPDLALTDVESSAPDALILPGGLHWKDFENTAVDSLIKAVHAQGRLVAGICAASGYLGRLGLLDTVAHTSNSPQFLKERAPKYTGEKLYRNELAVSDRKIISASGLGAIDFTYLIMRDLEIDTAENCSMWFRAFKHGDDPFSPKPPMESQCIRIKLRPGKTEQFLSWARSLSGRTNELKEALESEGLQSELMLLDRASNGDYVMLYTKAQSLASANAAFERSSLKIDHEAKQMMAETWDLSTIGQLERLIEVGI
jgi:putative intracellular protease/amidase